MSAVNPNQRTMTTQQALDWGLQHHQAGRLSQAEAIYRRILAEQPDNSDALNLLGVIESQFGRNGIAAESISRAIIINPAVAMYHNNLGVVLKDLGQFDAAAQSCRQAIRLQPDYAEAHNNLGTVLQCKGQFDQAIAAYRTALQIKPDYLETFNNLDATLLKQGHLSDLIFLLRCPPWILPVLDNIGLTRNRTRGSDGINIELAGIMSKPLADSKIELKNYLTQERVKLKEEETYLTLYHPQITVELVRSVTDALILEIKGETVEEILNGLPQDIRRILPPQDHPTLTLSVVTAL
jgi:tetratricopeptide (TPR) repeat protein